MIRTWYHYFPPSYVVDEVEKSRYRHFNTCCFLTVITMVFIVVNNYIFNFHQIQLFSAIFLALFAIIFVLFYSKRLKLTKAVNLYIAAGSSFVVAGAYVSGGFKSPVLFWSILIPLYAFWLLNQQYAWFWFFVACLIPVTFLVLDRFGFNFTNPYNYFDGYHKINALIIIFFLILNVFVVGNAFEKSKLKSIREINAANDELRSTLTALNQTKLELEAAEKHKDIFISQISHEMRTPMNAIIGITHLLKNKYGEVQEELLPILERSSRNLLYIIDDILDLTKIQTGKFNFQLIPFNLIDQLNTIYQTNKIRADEKQLDFYFHVSGDIPATIIGDPYRIAQILNNVIGNAIKFTESGSITFTVSYDEKTKEISFVIEDTGIGMTATETERAFHMFSQANEKIHLRYGGTGMGLSITRQLVDLFKGSIRADSEPGRGTTISIDLPVTIPEKILHSSAPAALSEKDIQDKLSGLHILIAEDNEVNQLVLKKILLADFPTMKVDFASDGEEVLQKVDENYFDVVLMDIQMPKKNGLETAREIRANSNERINQLKIIALTAYARTKEADNCLQSGMNDYTTKPVNKEELINKIFALLS